MIDISPLGVALGFGMAIVPLAIILWYGVPLCKRSLIAIVRMGVQLLFVGLYLKVVFAIDQPWLTGVWLAAMVLVADLSTTRSCGLRLRRMGGVLFVALLAGTLGPLLYMTVAVLHLPEVLGAQYAIPLGGLVLGNCLRADIVGLSRFFDSLRAGRRPYLLALSRGATRDEAVRPYLRGALDAALAPTVETIATIGLVSLPGTMTGVILAGQDPLSAVKYQIIIMLAIFFGTALTLLVAFRLGMAAGFTPYGLLDESIFKENG